MSTNLIRISARGGGLDEAVTARSPAEAVTAARALLDKGLKDVTVSFAPGTYYLTQPMVFSPADGSKAGSVTYRAEVPGTVRLAGGRSLECAWKPFRDGIWKTAVSPGLEFDQLFVNGKRQVRARFPNADPSDPRGYSGYTLPAGKIRDDEPRPDVAGVLDDNEDMTFSSGAPRGICFDPLTFSPRTWKRPSEAVIHIYQAHYWGNLQWEIAHIDRDNRQIWFAHGGHQMGAKWSHDPCEVNERSYFYIENVFEELDAPGEWYHDREESILYFYPPQGIELRDATVEVPQLDCLVRFDGTQRDPVCNVTLDGIRFALSGATFLKEYDIPSLSDWAIHRGGALFLEGTRDCTVRNCCFDGLGGNAIFLNNHNRNAEIGDSLFSEIGDSAICIVGSLNTTVGTQRNFGYECTVTNNLIRNCGVFGKQVAGVYISRAKRVTVSHNEIHAMPRAGICIGDGTWGGHVIEYNYIHDTCRETGDHGPFNAWGRDKYWCLVQSHTEYTRARNHFAGHVLVDAMEPVIMRFNFFREQSGWGLDLDDGASNYEIYNNLCVGVSIKLREGAYRTIYNNVWVNGANSPCFHVGNEHNHDRYFRNITVMSRAAMRVEEDLNFDMGAGAGEIYTLIAPPARSPWLEECDFNCFYSDVGEFVARAEPRREVPEESELNGPRRKYSLTEWQAMGLDRNSVFADPLFEDPDNDDYRVRPESPALKLGFENFDMDSFGLTDDYPDTFRKH